jgi:GntR family transcriptional repressor for pyruvate dehydrogenase complex
MRYLIDEELVETEGEPTKLPPLGQLAKELGVSRGKLREDMITAQAYGIIEMRPGDGTYIRPFDFYAAVKPLVLYSIACAECNFDRFYRLRAKLEVTFWHEAVGALGQAEFKALLRILDDADRKLQGSPIEIPHSEHREFHTLLFSKLDNPFAVGLLKAYWDAYEAVGLHRYFDLSYYQRMWSSHRLMTEAIMDDQYDKGQEILAQHLTLLEDRLAGGEQNR